MIYIFSAELFMFIEVLQPHTISETLPDRNIQYLKYIFYPPHHSSVTELGLEKRHCLKPAIKTQIQRNEIDTQYIFHVPPCRVDVD